MSPINSSICVSLRFSGSPKTYSTKTSDRKISPINSNLRSILKQSGGIKKLTQDPLSKKAVRFAVPIDDTNLAFKGFTTGYLNQIDDKRSKMARTRSSLNFKQKTAVWKTIRQHQGALPVKIGNTKAFFCSKKFESKLVTNKKEIKDESISTISRHELLLRNNLKSTRMVMMQCKVCSRKAYFPKKPENISNLDSFICNDCFVKSKSMVFKSQKPLAPKEAVLPDKNTGDQVSDEFEDKPIIITSVRSLSSPNIDDFQDQHITPYMEKINLELKSSQVQHENMKKTPTKVDNDIVDSSADRDGQSGNVKMVNVWTSEGYFTFAVPNKFENQTDEFELVSGQKRGSADDPILIDDA